jgi:tripartite-type tricarboxylate transporter receptor subunit TctC
MDRRHFVKGLGTCSFLACIQQMNSVNAQSAMDPEWPRQAVKIIVPFPPGGTADSMPRIVSEGLRTIWKQPIIIENRPGAGGNIGAEAVSVAAPDGYTLLGSPPPPIAINQSLYPKLAFDPNRFKAVAILSTHPNIVAVSKKLGVTGIKELIARAKMDPGKISVANQGNGSTSHLTAAMFEALAGVKFNHVPYRGTAPAMNDLVAGHVDLFFDNISSSLAQHRAGAISIIAVCSTSRVRELPDLPTVSEEGITGFSAIAWNAIMAPPGTPDAIVNKINADILTVLKDQDIRRRIIDLAGEPVGSSPSLAASFIASERLLWADVIKKSNIKLE